MPPHADDTTRHLSLILSGAVSLGAYEGGVVGQIAYALAQWNAEQAAAEKPPRAVIDVIAGASAGSMTGAMLAYHLMKGTEAREFVNAVHESWCGKGTTLPKMLDTRPPDQHALLSSSGVDRIASAFFADQAKPADPSRIHQDEVIFSCTVTALDAIPYQFRLRTAQGQPETMQAWTRQDWATFSITADPDTPVMELSSHCSRRSGNGLPSSWDRLISFGVASGAFPVTFQPMEISRFNGFYPLPLKELPSKERPGWTRMRYTDGGVLDNMPFKRAAEGLESLVGRSMVEERLYVMIEVEPFQARVDPAQSSPAPQAAARDTTPVLRVLSATFEAMRQQSLYDDLYQSQEVNRRLEGRDQHLYPLLAAAARALTDTAAPLEEARRALQEYLQHKWFPDPRPTVESELAHYQELAARPGTALNRAANGLSDAQRELFLLQAALSDHVSSLRDKCPIRVERIRPEEGTHLAGRALGAFAGFLDQDLTHHDFLCGLHDAYHWLVGLAAQFGWSAPAPVNWFLKTSRGSELARRELSQFPSKMLNDASKLAVDHAVPFVAGELGMPRGPLTGIAEKLLEAFLEGKLRAHGVADVPADKNPGSFNPATDQA